MIIHLQSHVIVEFKLQIDIQYNYHLAYKYNAEINNDNTDRYCFQICK